MRVKIVAHTKFDVTQPAEVVSVIWDFPTVKLAELRTHRRSTQSDNESIETSENEKALCMNANSTRAVPVARQIAKVVNNPYVPIWTAQKAGMQGDEITDPALLEKINIVWLGYLESSIRAAEQSAALGVHKQDAALPIVPFSFTTCIVTMTIEQWQYFFNQRCNDAAYPYFRDLARLTQDAIENSVPRKVKGSGYHIPFIDEIERLYPDTGESCKVLIGASMCAKISFDTQESRESAESHIERARRLIKAKHAIDDHIAVVNFYQVDNPFGMNVCTLRAYREFEDDLPF